jgi:hypothetical protein
MQWFCRISQTFREYLIGVEPNEIKRLDGTCTSESSIAQLVLYETEARP